MSRIIKKKLLIILENDFLFYPDFLNTLYHNKLNYNSFVWIVSSPPKKSRYLELIKNTYIFPLKELFFGFCFVLKKMKCKIQNNTFMYSQIKKKFNINFEKIVGNINKKENFIKFNKIKPDYVLSCSSQIIDKKYLKTKSKFINMHFSLLPNYRGFMPIFYSMINGENKIGISFHEMTSKIDQGMIYHRKAFSLEKNKSLIYHYEKLFNEAPSEFIKCLNNFNMNTKKNIKNNYAKGSYYGLPTKSDLNCFFEKKLTFF